MGNRMNRLCGASRDAKPLTLRCQRRSVGIGTSAADPIRAVSSAMHRLLPPYWFIHLFWIPD